MGQVNLLLLVALVELAISPVQSDYDDAMRNNAAGGQTLLERRPMPEAKQILRLADVSLAHFERHFFANVLELVQDRQRDIRSFLIDDFAFFHLELQLNLCWPEFSLEIKTAVGQIFAGSVAKISTLTEKLQPLARDVYWSTIGQHRTSTFNGDRMRCVSGATWRANELG